MGNYTLYCHLTPSNKAYIGVTKNNIKKRWNYGNGYKNNKYFYRAIVKYGWNNIEHMILFENITKNDAFKLEKTLIKLYDLTNPMFGYNIESGGQGGSHPPHIRKIISEKVSGSLNGMYGVRRFGVNNPMYGKSSMKGKLHTDKSKQLMSKARTGKYTGSDNPVARKVICIDTGEVFDTIKSAGIKYNIAPSNITTCCKGRLKTAGSFRWEYID